MKDSIRKKMIGKTCGHFRNRSTRHPASRIFEESSELAGLSPSVRYPLKTLQERVDLRLCKGLAVGVKFRQQRWQRLREGGEGLLKFRECATKGTNSLQVFAQSQPSFCFALPDALPILTGEARRSTLVPSGDKNESQADLASE